MSNKMLRHAHCCWVAFATNCGAATHEWVCFVACALCVLGALTGAKALCFIMLWWCMPHCDKERGVLGGTVLLGGFCYQLWELPLMSGSASWWLMSERVG